MTQKEDAMSMANENVNDAEEEFEELEEGFYEAEDSVEDYIRRNPLAAVMGAFLVGLLFGRLRIL
jgi:hypothetical protein